MKTGELPTFSVIVPLYNKAPYVSRALMSICTQSFSNYEVIVVDDGSTDGSGDIVRGGMAVDPRFHLITTRNNGVACARNIGIRNSSAPWIAFLDADDEWLPNHLEKLLEGIRLFPEAALFYTLFESHEASGKVIINGTMMRGIGHVDFFEELGRRYFSTDSIAIKRSALPEGAFPSEFRLGEDMYVWLYIALRYPVVQIPVVTTRTYRNIPKQLTSMAKQGDYVIQGHTALSGLEFACFSSKESFVRYARMSFSSILTHLVLLGDFHALDRLFNLYRGRDVVSEYAVFYRIVLSNSVLQIFSCWGGRTLKMLQCLCKGRPIPRFGRIILKRKYK